MSSMCSLLSVAIIVVLMLSCAASDELQSWTPPQEFSHTSQSTGTSARDYSTNATDPNDDTHQAAAQTEVATEVDTSDLPGRARGVGFLGTDSDATATNDASGAATSNMNSSAVNSITQSIIQRLLSTEQSVPLDRSDSASAAGVLGVRNDTILMASEEVMTPTGAYSGPNIEDNAIVEQPTRDTRHDHPRPDDVQVGCKQLRSKRYISDGFCTSLKPITEVVCTGHCLPVTDLPWYAEFIKVWARTKVLEYRCVDDFVKKRKVKLNCENGEVRSYRIKVVKSCKCKRFMHQQNLSHIGKNRNKNRNNKNKGRRGDSNRDRRKETRRRQSEVEREQRRRESRHIDEEWHKEQSYTGYERQTVNSTFMNAVNPFTL